MNRLLNSFKTEENQNANSLTLSEGWGGYLRMKRLLYIIFILLVGFQQLSAQDTDALQTFREQVLPQFKDYFTQVELTESGQLKLMATEKYVFLSLYGKKEIMNHITAEWDQSLILVFYGLKRDMWSYAPQTQKALFLDSWDISIPKNIKAISTRETEKTNLHPWFVYIGGLTSFDSYKNISMALNTKVGFFLLLNRWDLALTLNGGLYGNIEAAAAASSNIGIMSKFYFPIQKLRLSPGIGGELSYSSTGVLSETSEPFSHNINKSLIVGVSWYVGIGSLDLDFKIGDGFTTMIGYTFSPSSKKK